MFHGAARRTCFNGATDFHRWKFKNALAFERHAHLLQWGHRFSSVEMRAQRYMCWCARGGFNGATDFHRWKCGVRRRVTLLRIGASMGPPIFIGGNWSCTPLYQTPPISFNGATDFHRWKYPFVCVKGTDPSGFNGATDFHRWKCLSRHSSMSRIFSLQWGHRFSSVEMLSRYTKRNRCRRRFNGATDFHRWKSTRAARRTSGHQRLQWGHRFSSVEMRCR